MMSAALLMLAGVEQAGKSTGSADLSVDQGKPEAMMSFAKSFNDRVDESALLQGKSSASSPKDASIGLLLGSKAAILTKKLNAVVAMPGEGKELTHSVQDITAHGKVKNAASSLGGAVQAPVVTDVKAAVNGSAVKNVAPAVEEGETTNDASSSSSASSAVPVVLQPNDDVVAPAGSTAQGRPLASSAGSAFVQKETESAGKTKEISSARKTAKMPENTSSGTVPVVLQPNDDVVASAGPTAQGRPLVSSAGSAFVQKETESAGKTKEIFSARKMPENTSSGAAPVVLQPNDDVVASAGPTAQGRPLVSSAGSAFVQKEAESAGKAKEISSARKTANMPESPGTSKTVQKAIMSDGNVVSKPAEASLKDAGPSPQGIVTGVLAPPKDDVRPTGDHVGEAIPGMAVASPRVSSPVASALTHKETGHETRAGALNIETATTSSDGQPALPKIGGELEKAVTAAVSAGNGGDNKIQSASGPTTMVHSAAGSIASGTALIGVVSGSMPGEAVLTKPQVGDASAHTAGLTVGSREQDGLGVATAPTEAIPTMLKATPTALEVGIQDGTHGWLKVRAEMADGGVVNASVSAASSTGQEMLHRELPAITAYLQQEKVAVNAIAVHTPLGAGAGQGSSTGMDGAGGQTPQGGHEGSEPQQNIRRGLPAGPDEAMAYRSLHGVDEDGLLSLATYASGGSWLSVRA